MTAVGRVLAASCCMLLLALLLAADAGAATRAWLDRDRVALGETATLNIETDDPGADAPDFTPLARDFDIGARSSRRQFSLDGGAARETMLYAIALEPRREGLANVPSLRLGSARTQPLTMTVTAAVPARSGGLVFIEAEADAGSPYVQQAVGYVVRLYYATQLISGQLDQPAPEGAALQRIGGDLQYSREIQGRRYTVVERRYLLLPERSGALTIPPARFVGRGVGGFFDEFFGDGQRALSTVGPRRVLDVRAMPSDASLPWLPLRGLSLRFVDPPVRARAGEAVELVLQADADGANATQLPPLELEAADGSQVFAEPPEIEETFEAGRPRVRITRRFSVVPAGAGTLRLAAAGIGWWDVRAAAARTATVPALSLPVAAGAAPVRAAPGPGAAPAAGSGETTGSGPRVRVPGVQGTVPSWAFATVVFALLWLATLAWALSRRGAGPVAAGTAPPPAGGARPRTRWSDRAFHRVLDTGGLDAVADALCAAASPPVTQLDALAALLDDPAQHAALARLQQARWGGGDAAGARAGLRAAFRGGPRWRGAAAVEAELLDPLYPRPAGPVPPANQG